MQSEPRVAVLGGGSWATAMIKLLTDNLPQVGWYMRNEQHIAHIQHYRHNPNYLNSLELPVEKLHFTSALRQAVDAYEILFLAIPAAFVPQALEHLPTDAMRNKIIVSGVKGMIPEQHQTISQYFQHYYGMPAEQLCLLTGPCHSEEVAMEKLSYLTVASVNQALRQGTRQMLTTRYLKTLETDDAVGTELAAVLKNVYAMAVGIAQGLGYGDNYQAVLVATAIREMDTFLQATYPGKRQINASAYLGDLLVTAYSHFSRNRMFGVMIGKGYSVESTRMEMKMIAEGYYAIESLKAICQQKGFSVPILKAVYRILYKHRPPSLEFQEMNQFLA